MGKLRVRDMKGLWVEAAIRLIFFTIFLVLERAKPFTRVIQPEELWLYKYPHSESYVPVTILWPTVVLVPTLIIGGFYLLRRDSQDALNAMLAVTLGLSLNGFVTDVIKVIVGRPRPDFFWRCFPDGISNPEMLCTGPDALVNDGRKSFPSGHSSFSFAGMCFVSLYLAGKLRAFSRPPENGSAWRMCVVLAPLLLATCVALSRTCDYHHHWQDVTIGSLIGLCISTLCYRLYFPSPASPLGHLSHSALNSLGPSHSDLHPVTSCPALMEHDAEMGLSSSSENLLEHHPVKWI